MFYSELRRKGVTGTRDIPIGILSIAFEFQFHGEFQSNNLEKKIALREHPGFFIANSKEEGMTSEVSLSENLVDMKARNNHHVNVLKPYLFVPVCLLIELH